MHGLSALRCITRFQFPNAPSEVQKTLHQDPVFTPTVETAMLLQEGNPRSPTRFAGVSHPGMQTPRRALSKFFLTGMNEVRKASPV